MNRWQSILDFWFGPEGEDPDERRTRWFRSGPEADAALADRFGADHAAVVAGEREAWLEEARSCLA